MKRVAVIGGGPSGLAAAKALLDVGLSPVIFEAASTVGGLWSKSSPSRRVWEHLRTNLSKYTCCFADMPWPKEAQLHPTNQQVCDYLHQYTDRFLITPFASATVNHDNTPIFHFNTKITKLSHFPETGKYLLQYTSAASDGTTTIVDNTEEFDKVVIASGFFNQHHNRSPANLSTPQASSSSGAAAISKDEMGNIIYADQYQSPEPFQGKTVIIVGASFSGCEIAAEIATVAKKVYHIVPRYSFVLPRMIPLNPLHPATPFLPLDIVFYALNEERQKQVQQHFQVIHNDKGEDAGDLASASPPFSSSSSSLSFEVLFKDLKDAEKTTSYLSQVVGTGNAHVDPLASLSSAFITSIQRGEEKPIVAISDEYKSMVRAGKIEVIAGRYVDYHPSMESGVNKTVINLLKNEESAQVLIEDSIDQTILCTGYSPDVSYLDSALRSILQYSPEHTLLPMILYKEQFHPSLPGLHFVGMYKGPYFGVMELQARLTAQYLAGLRPLPSEDEIHQGLEASLRIRNQSPKPQFPHSDYVGMMLDLAKDLQLSILQPTKAIQSSSSSKSPLQVIVPSCFADCKHDSDTTSPVLDDMYSEIQQRQRGKNVAQSILYALEGGTWAFQRELFDKDHGSISTVDGKVKFSFIFEPSYSDKHLWYHEEGIFTTARGQRFDVSQSYIYSYNRDLDSLDIFFSTVGKPTVIDRPFISLHFKPSERGWVAKADHLCGEDNYYADFEIGFNGLNIERMKIVFDVLGPAKNYRSTTMFQLLK